MHESSNTYGVFHEREIENSVMSKDPPPPGSRIRNALRGNLYTLPVDKTRIYVTLRNDLKIYMFLR